MAKKLKDTVAGYLLFEQMTQRERFARFALGDEPCTWALSRKATANLLIYSPYFGPRFAENPYLNDTQKKVVGNYLKAAFRRAGVETLGIETIDDEFDRSVGPTTTIVLKLPLDKYEQVNKVIDAPHQKFYPMHRIARARRAQQRRAKRAAKTNTP